MNKHFVNTHFVNARDLPTLARPLQVHVLARPMQVRVPGVGLGATLLLAVLGLLLAKVAVDVIAGIYNAGLNESVRMNEIQQ